MGEKYRTDTWYLVSGETLIILKFKLQRLEEKLKISEPSVNELLIDIRAALDTLPVDPPEAF